MTIKYFLSNLIELWNHGKGIVFKRVFLFNSYSLPMSSPPRATLRILQPIRSIKNCLTFFPGLLSSLFDPNWPVFVTCFKPAYTLTSTQLTTIFLMFTFRLLIFLIIRNRSFAKHNDITKYNLNITTSNDR